MFRIRELFQACMFYCYISNVCVFSKRLLLLSLRIAHIYEESTGDVARLRGGEKAERSEESALFKLLSGCFCFFCFMFYYVSSVSLSRVLLLSFASLAQEYYYYSLRTPSLLGRADSTELIKTVFSP